MFSLKSASRSLQQSKKKKKKLPQVSQDVFKAMFELLHFHEITLANKCNQPLVRKIEIIFQTKKGFIMNCSKLIINGFGRFKTGSDNN